MSENNLNLNSAQFGGMPVPPVPTPQMFGGAGIGSALNAGISASGSSKVSIIGYVAPQKNVLKKVPLHIGKARDSWKAIKKDGSIPDGWAAELTVTDNSGKTKTVKYDSSFKESVYKAYMAKYNPGEYEEVCRIPAYRADTTEAKVDRFILKADTDSQAINELARTAASTTSAQKGIAVLTSAELAAFFQQTSTTIIPIEVVRKAKDGSGAEEAISIGSLYFDITQVTAKKQGQSIKKQVVVSRIRDKDGKRSTIRELSIFGREADESAKIPYAVLRKNTKTSTFGPVDESSVLNFDRFKKLFPTQDPTALPERLKLSKKDFNNDDKAYKEAKAAQFVSYEESSAAALGIDADVWARLAALKSTKGGKVISSEEAADSSLRALEALKLDKSIRVRG